MLVTIDRKTGLVTDRAPSDKQSPIDYQPLAAVLAERILQEDKNENI